jgi:hypothetical protein
MAPRLVVACLAALALAAPAHAAVRPVSGTAPAALRGFLLRVDEPRERVFSRTPSFAWNPVPGAVRYEFQLSTSSLFREGGIVYRDETLTSPAAAVPISLPWITGNPYSLYARVRAVLPRTITPWSSSFGFNMRWPSTPQPIATQPGLIRWTPVEGATGYHVWYLFPNGAQKIFPVSTNVADQREWYTFHQGSTYSGQVKWRIRAVRTVTGAAANGLPVVSHGPWSPIYTTKNPAFATGKLALHGTISDAISTPSQPTEHRLMPAFTFSGNAGLYGGTAELYRVYVFTDSDCVNVVFRSAIVGSPAYAPRPVGGPLPLPHDAAGIAAARTQFFFNSGDEGATFSYDLERVKATEAEPAATPHQPAAPQQAAAAQPQPPKEGQAPAAAPAPAFAPPAAEGAPVDLWDTDFPRGRYYWTVIPVSTAAPVALASTLAQAAGLGGTTVTVSTTGFAANDVIAIGTGATLETATVVSVAGNTLTLSSALKFGHGAGETVAKSGGALEYRDQELAQEACEAGRIASFGKTSEPVVTASAAPYASGLSPNGRLVAAASSTPSFYGRPLVAWTPALGAKTYEVQWSRTRYPFRAQGLLPTYSTAATLPLTPGTWWYRVRGINYSVPTGAQPMSWSDPAMLRVTRPTFKIVGGKRR